LQSPEAKLAQIAELAADSKGRVITLDDATYHYYAVSKPRPYALVVFLTAAHPKFKCSICKQIDNEMAVLAASYAKSGSDATPVFFLRLDYDSSQTTFSKYGVTSVPLLFYVEPQMGVEKEYYLSARDRFQVAPQIDAESLAIFLNERADVNVTIERSKIGSYLMMLAIFGILAALVQPMVHAIPFVLRVLQVGVICHCHRIR
jgi:hypothetical protein